MRRQAGGERALLVKSRLEGGDLRKHFTNLNTPLVSCMQNESNVGIFRMGVKKLRSSRAAAPLRTDASIDIFQGKLMKTLVLSFYLRYFVCMKESVVLSVTKPAYFASIFVFFLSINQSTFIYANKFPTI